MTLSGPLGTGSVHPHLRGEHPMRDGKRSYSYGSSPPAWGTLGSREPALCRWRFIPTCVGNTPPLGPHARQQPVHPHLRGEHFCLTHSDGLIAGSSPPAWGTLKIVEGNVVMLRFIPTCVGNTPRRFFRFSNLPVHPHLRGEHKNIRSNGCINVGSSPPAWGTPVKYYLGGKLWRFIPTCVGNTNLKIVCP